MEWKEWNGMEINGMEWNGMEMEGKLKGMEWNGMVSDRRDRCGGIGCLDIVATETVRLHASIRCCEMLGCR